MRLLACAAALLALLMASCAVVDAAVTTGTLSSSDGFAFLTKFCFQDLPNDESVGVLTVHVTMPLYNGGQNQSSLVLAIYDDEVGSWDEIMSNWNSWSCEQKLAHATMDGSKKFRVVQGTNVVRPSDDSDTLSMDFLPEPFGETQRPHFWFFALARCEGGFNNVAYSTHAWQLHESSWNEEFSQELFGLNSLYLSFFFFFSLLVLLHCMSTYKLQAALLYLHPLVKLFLCILLLEYLSVFAHLLHYGAYARDGVGIVALLKVGQVAFLSSRSLFMLLLLLLAKGWTINIHRGSSLQHGRAILGLTALHFLLEIIALIWGYASVDPRKTSLNSGVEALQILLNVVWLVFMVWFVWSLRASWRDESNPSKRGMYVKLGILFVPWMFAPPVVSFLVFALDPWVRERVVVSLTVSLTFWAYAWMAYLFAPARATEHFAITADDVASVRGDESYRTL